MPVLGRRVRAGCVWGSEVFGARILVFLEKLGWITGRPGAPLSHTVSSLMGVKPSPRVRTLNVATRTSDSIMVTKFEG